MATTWMKALHRSGGSIAAALDRTTDYIENPEKTNDGELIDGYECEPFTAQSEFLFSKRMYEQKTGRDQGKNDVIAYHIRMSFKPGEVTAEQALELGRELAMRWTKGKHQFIVAAHTNTKNPHAHIVFNSVNLNCDGKFQDFKRSAFALRRVSDQICLEHGLSVIENPGLSKGYNRHEYLGEQKPPTAREQLRDLIDSLFPDCKDFDSFFSELRKSGVEIKQGKQLSFKLPGSKKFIRQDSLGSNYSESAIQERISGKLIIVPKPKISVPDAPKKFNLLIDVQEKLNQGYGEGFRQWATLRNLKDAAKTLIYLQENKLDDYELLVKTTDDITNRYHELSDKTKANSQRMKDITELQKQIGTYSKTRDMYKQYLDTPEKKRENFFEENRADITLHKSTKKYFDSLGYGKDKKLPTINMLKQEYAILAAENKKFYPEQKQCREKMIELLMAKQNIDMVLGTGAYSQKRDISHDRSRYKSYER